MNEDESMTAPTANPQRSSPWPVERTPRAAARPPGATRLAVGVLSAAVVLVATGCSLLPGKPAPAPSFFTLQPTFTAAAEVATEATAAEADEAAEVGVRAAGPPPTILVSPPAARPGFDGRRMAYVRRPFELRYFARHQWVEPPARLLEPLVALALERDGRFRAVASGALADPSLRLETEIVALQQEFDVAPSRVRFVLAARLVDPRAGRLVATTELEALEPAESDDPYGGVVAANRAVARVLEALAAWCGEQADRSALAR